LVIGNKLPYAFGGGEFMHPKKATRSDWKIQPMPELKTQLQVEEVFTKEEYEYLSWGLIPKRMEDKWFIFLEDNWLYFHRSWSGFCIFQVRLERFEDGYQIAEAWVNSDPDQQLTYGENKLFLLTIISYRIKNRSEAEYRYLRIIIAAFICILFYDPFKSYYSIFELTFICYLFPKSVFNNWDFYRDLYDFIDYYNIKIVFDS
jgi:hypothetical protein